MTFPDTIPTWMTNTPAIPECPSWCLEPAGHHNPTEILPGDWTRFHVAYRQDVPTGRRPVRVEVAGHESWENGSLAVEPAGLTITDGEDLTPAHAAHLLEVLIEATTLLARISEVQA